MKKIYKFLIVLCMFFSVVSQTAYAGCGVGSFMLSVLGKDIDCDKVDPNDPATQASLEAMAQGFWNNGTSSLSSENGNVKSWDWYVNNYTCGENCQNATLYIRNAIKKECDNRCSARDEAEQESCQTMCSNVNTTLMTQEKQGAADASNELGEVIDTITAIEKVTDIICTYATRIAAIGALAVGSAAAAGLVLSWAGTGVLAVLAKGLGLAAIGTVDVVAIRKLFPGPAFPKILALFYSFNKGCWFCPIFDKIYDVVNNLATDLYSMLRDYSLSFLAIIAFGWILFHVLKFITTLHAPNVGEFLTHIFKTLGMVMLAAIFLFPDVSFLTGYLIEMPTNFALGLSDGILQTSGFSGNGVVTNRDVTRDLNCPIVKSDYTEHVTTEDICAPADDAAKYKGKALSKSLHDEMSCLLKRVSYEMITGMAVGAAIVVESLDAGLLTILPKFSMLFIGLVILIAYFYFFIRIPFFLLDLVLRFGFVVIMLPVFVVCFPFPSTRGYSKKGWEMLLAVLVQMISLCIFICLALAIINSVWKVRGVP